MTTQEGYEWTETQGLRNGLPCEGIIELPASEDSEHRYDVIVIGAGFAGLIASRDLALRGCTFLRLPLCAFTS